MVLNRLERRCSLNIFEGDLNARSIFDATFTANRRNRSTFDRDIGDENYFASVLEAGRKRLDDDQSLSNIITDRDLEAIQKHQRQVHINRSNESPKDTGSQRNN